jgi:tetratricopeptide (TPR) repeat protein
MNRPGYRQSNWGYPAEAGCCEEIEKNPNDIVPYKKLVALLEAENRLPEAIQSYHRALESDTDNTTHTREKLSFLLAARDKILHIFIQQALAEDPSMTCVYYITLANLLLIYEHWSKAEEVYRKAIEIVPTRSEALDGLGKARMKQNRLVESETLCSRT